MAKITREQLNRLIKEETNLAVLEEGIFDALAVIGRDAKQYMKGVSVRGGERASRREFQSAQNALEASLNKLRTEFERTKSPRVAELIATAEAGMKALRTNAGSEVVQAMAAGADEDGELPDERSAAERGIELIKQDIEADNAREDAAEGGDDAPEVAPAAQKAAVSVPKDVLELVISYLGQAPKYRSKSANELRAMLDEPGILNTMARGVQRQAKKSKVAEGKITVTRQALKEVLSLLTDDAL